MISSTPTRDVLLPSSDRTALIQVIVVAAVLAGATYLVRRERALKQLVLGLRTVLLGLMVMRTLN